MLYTNILKNNYQDSINLMRLTKEINSLNQVNKSQIMMGTDANKEILQTSNLLTDEAKQAKPNDLIIVVDANNKSTIDEVMKKIDNSLSDLSTQKNNLSTKEVSNLDDALEELPEANMGLFSIAGEYAVPEIKKALDKGLHVFSFTDNISLEDEVSLKKIAKEKGLLMMGPDCGTGIISGTPLAFTNAVKPGNIGIVAASGTGIQEVTTIIDRLGGGVLHAIGTGGRDLKGEIGAITTKEAIVGLENDDKVEVICLISKPPAKEVRDDVYKLLQSLSKPVVAIFLGENPESHEGNVYLAHTLDEAARITVDLANNNEIKSIYLDDITHDASERRTSDKEVVGLYSGGTLAEEAKMMISESSSLELVQKDGYILHSKDYKIIDLGDDEYTRGRPHPMIDPQTRIDKIKEYANKDGVGTILLDVVLGYGAHEDMAGALAPTIKEVKEKAKNQGNILNFVATVVGTENDPQGYSESREKLEEVGVYVEDSNQKAVRRALGFRGEKFNEHEKNLKDYTGETVDIPEISKNISELLSEKPKVVNIGIDNFNEAIRKFKGTSVQYNWKPRAGGNKKLIKILDELDKLDEEINTENNQVIDKIKKAQPFLVDVVKAKEVISEFSEVNEKLILHAGPPIQWEEMTGPMKGSCIGAAIFEGWANDKEEAMELFDKGNIKFTPCHHVNAVGPMGGITSANMPVLVVENKLENIRAYCTMNEGIGKVLRFGAFSEEVVERLQWMRDTLGPTLSKAVKLTDEGINLNVIIAKAITMGDEFHQRNIAASLNFLKEVAPLITKLDISEEEKFEVIKFLSDTDQFFLNIMMATGKSIVDVARKEASGTVVTTMTRNGVRFGIRIAELGNEWFTAPVNTPKGLYFTGFSEEDGNPDIGDSSITETVGVGGMSMIAAPGVTRFVGAGGFQDALDVSNEMSEICVDSNQNWTIPNWDFKGAPTGIDIRKVVETGITPIINTGIAHKEPGLGQVGAGTVRAPIECFEKALVAYAKSKGIEVE
ncbi:DUF1116 domain-containing protein [Dolosigranulum pigrum]|uniref:DUF1116 domain-containing protein n=1 Tax=Dolosigranulum pigrum TaxID=29394 RepID=UPI001AD85982|nr:DUF1116 domain-containing protein [Dolosigranulum pigrum]QTJ37058.1 acyl-CoA synthetase FdrA [Dolosigranulum pigrum]